MGKEKVMRIGILPLKEFQARTIAHAKGEYDITGEPKKWYYSLHGLGQLLCEENLNLLRIIQEQKPETLKELAELSGKKLPSLSRTIKSLEALEIVTLTKEGKQVRPTVNVTGFQIEIDLKRLT